MGTDYRVIGIIPLGDRLEKLKKARDACIEAEIEIPNEITDSLDEENLDEKGLKVEIEFERYCKRDECGIEVNLKDIPEGVDILRFYFY